MNAHGVYLGLSRLHGLNRSLRNRSGGCNRGRRFRLLHLRGLLDRLCLLRLCDESLSGDLTALAARISRLEESAAGLPAAPRAVSPSRAQSAAPPAANAAAKSAGHPSPAPASSPPWEEPVPAAEEPPLPEEPPLGEEPAGERVFDIPAEESASTPEPVETSAVNTGGFTAGTGWWRGFAENCKGQMPAMVGIQHGEILPVPLEDAASRTKFLPTDHPLIQVARDIGIFFGD